MFFCIGIPHSLVSLLLLAGRGIGYAILLLWVSCSSYAFAGRELAIYIDADRSVSMAAGLAIEQGVRTALSESGNTLGSYPVKIKLRDHRGSSLRSRLHLEEYLADSQALALFSGLHSSPILDNIEFINAQEILVLDPWAAAGPITRPQSAANWVFRLSIDDNKAGKVISQSAANEGFKKPFLLLEATGWGDSNLKTMVAALAEMGIQHVGVERFNWSLGIHEARFILQRISQSEADVIFLVANAPEGKTLSQAMLYLPPKRRLPLRSHWGITGGDFPHVISVQQRALLDLSFIQTRFSFINHGHTLFAQKVLLRAKELFPSKIARAEDIQAPAGFIHAYDLTRLLISACQQIVFSGDIREDRRQVHAALEALQQPVEGLIKTYYKPFGDPSKDGPDAHEALNERDFTMGFYGANNEIILQEAPQ